MNENRTELFAHQQKAVDWIIQNDYTGIVSMAPGAGGSYTLLGALSELSPDQTVILLVRDMDSFRYYQALLRENGVPDSDFVLASPTNDNWQSEIQEIKQRTKIHDGDPNQNKSLIGSKAPNIVLAPLNTVRREKEVFVSEIPNQVLVVDSVESAPDMALSDITDLGSKRLGVTTLPLVWFENYRQDEIEQHFGDQTYSYSIKQGIVDNVLNQYEYIPIVTRLSSDESDDLRTLQKKLSKWQAHSNSDESQMRMAQAAMQRKQLQADATAKYRKLRDLLRTGIKTPTLIIAGTINQVNKVEEVFKTGLSEQSSVYGTPARCTGETGISERNSTIQEVFGNYSDKAKTNVVIATHAAITNSPTPGARSYIIMSENRNWAANMEILSNALQFSTDQEPVSVYDIMPLPNLEDESITGHSSAEGPIQRAGLLTTGANNRYDAQRYLYRQLKKYDLGHLVYVTPGF